jgi:hypothetical protein
MLRVDIEAVGLDVEPSFRERSDFFFCADLNAHVFRNTGQLERGVYRHYARRTDDGPAALTKRGVRPVVHRKNPALLFHD